MAQQSTAHQASVTMPAASNSTGDRRALLLKLATGEMFKGFQHETIARDLVMKRTPVSYTHLTLPTTPYV